MWKRDFKVFSEVINLDNEKNPIVREIEHGIQLYVYVNKVFSSGERVITVTLLNTNNASHDNAIEISENSAFQVEVQVSSAKEKSIFTAVRKKIDIGIDPELQELDLLYSDNHYYARGHGMPKNQMGSQNKEPLWIKSNFFP